jgi:hypothetical protein
MNNVDNISFRGARDHQHLIERFLRDPGIDLAKLEHMVALQERMLRWQAETEWNTAMATAQAGMHAVANDTTNPQTRSKYARYAAIDAAICPIIPATDFAELQWSRAGKARSRSFATSKGGTQAISDRHASDGKGPAATT